MAKLISSLRIKHFLLFSLLLTFLVITLVFCFYHRHVINCNYPDEAIYSQYDRLWLADQFSAQEKLQIQNLAVQAQERIKHVFGPMKAEPIVIVTANIEQATQLGANAWGTAHRTLFGQCVVIGPEGLNIDVLAHELMHAEVAERLGLWKMLTELPTWFDEGIALLVDWREPYLPENITLSVDQVEAVRNMFYGYQFASGNIMENYQAARLAVTDIDTQTVYADLAKVEQGQAFSSVFKFQ